MTSNFDLSKYTVNRSVEEIELPLAYCEVCGRNGIRLDCDTHESAKIENVKLRVKQIPWNKKNQIISAALYWDTKGNSHFQLDYFKNECLKFMISDAPWGQTNDIFLIQIADGPLAEALETILPSMNNASVRFDDLKKGR